MPQFTTLDRPDSYYEEVTSYRNEKHDIHCMGSCCNKTPVCCPVCQYEFRYVAGLVHHRIKKHESKRGHIHTSLKQGLAKRELIPDGLGYLVKLFASPNKSHINTENISRFSKHLEDLLHVKHKQRKHSIINKAKLQALKEDSSGTTAVNITIPNKYLLPIYQIWETTGVNPNHILLAIQAYGLEYLAKELRKYPIFPEVTKAPETELTTPQKQKVNPIQRTEQDDIPKTYQKKSKRPFGL